MILKKVKNCAEIWEDGECWWYIQYIGGRKHNLLKASYIGWFKIQCVWSSVIQGLEGPGWHNMGSNSKKVSV